MRYFLLAGLCLSLSSAPLRAEEPASAAEDLLNAMMRKGVIGVLESIPLREKFARERAALKPPPAPPAAMPAIIDPTEELKDSLHQENYRRYALGGLGGRRAALAERGIEPNLWFTAEGQRVTSGGLRRGGRMLGKIDVVLSVDTEKAGGWRGGSFLLAGLGTYGGNPSELVGDAQVTSNLEAYDTFKLFEAWCQQSAWDGAASLRGGMMDYNSEFYASRYAGPFSNANFGIGLEASQVGPSIYNTTAVGGRLKLSAKRGFYALAGMYDGVPGHPGHRSGTQILFGRSDGAFYGAELGMEAPADAPAYFKTGVGAWYRTTDFEDFSLVKRSANGGIYAVGEGLVFAESDPKQGLGVFAKMGWAQGDRNAWSHSLAAGLNYTGLIPGRDADIAGLGVTRAERSRAYLNANPASREAETAAELTYDAAVLPWLHMRPDLQVVYSPSTDAAVKRAVLLNFRVVAQF